MALKHSDCKSSLECIYETIKLLRFTKRPTLNLFYIFFFRWDDELSEVAQVWADQCASVIYEHKSDSYPKIFHERGSERMTSMFSAPPGKFIFKHFSQLFFLKDVINLYKGSE